MSFMTPILMVPSVYCACAVLQPSATVSAVRLISDFIVVFLLGRFMQLVRNSDAKIVVQFAEIGAEFGIGELVDDLAMLHHVVAIGHGRGEMEILLDQQDGEAALLQDADGLADLLD